MDRKINWKNINKCMIRKLNIKLIKHMLFLFVSFRLGNHTHNYGSTGMDIDITIGSQSIHIFGAFFYSILHLFLSRPVE